MSTLTTPTEVTDRSALSCNHVVLHSGNHYHHSSLLPRAAGQAYWPTEGRRRKKARRCQNELSGQREGMKSGLARVWLWLTCPGRLRVFNTEANWV